MRCHNKFLIVNFNSLVNKLEFQNSISLVAMATSRVKMVIRICSRSYLFHKLCSVVMYKAAMFSVVLMALFNKVNLFME